MTAKKPVAKTPVKAPAKAPVAAATSDAEQKVIAERAAEQLSAHLAKVPTPNGTVLNVDLAKVGQDFAEMATKWLLPDSDPAQDICNTRAEVRIATFNWPTVLRLNPKTFEDLQNHPQVIDYLCRARTAGTDVRTPANVLYALPFLFGVRRIEIDEAVDTAELIA